MAEVLGGAVAANGLGADGSLGDGFMSFTTGFSIFHRRASKRPDYPKPMACNPRKDAWLARRLRWRAASMRRLVIWGLVTRCSVIWCLVTRRW